MEGAHVIVGERQLHQRRAAADGAADGGQRVVLQDDRVQVGQVAQACMLTAQERSGLAHVLTLRGRGVLDQIPAYGPTPLQHGTLSQLRSSTITSQPCHVCMTSSC